MLTEKFGVGNLIYDPKIYEKVNAGYDGDLEFYYNLAKKHNGRVLELCCGTGRLTIPLKEKGINISGVDFTSSMLNEAKRKANKKDLKIDFILGDMKDLVFPNSDIVKFDMIFIPFNSMQNTYTIEDISKVFSSVTKYLKDDGIFVFDIFNPSIHYMIKGEKDFREISRFNLDDGRQVIIEEKNKYDSATQTYRCKWKHKIGNEVFIENLDMRCFFPIEMDLHVKYNNFTIIEKFGDFKNTKFNSNSMKQVYICKKSK